MSSKYKSCFYCERKFGDIPYNSNFPLKRTDDHIHPISKGGTFHKLNIIQACEKCNSIKGDKTLEEFECFIQEWINDGFQTRKGYTPSLLWTISINIKKLYETRNEYKILIECLESN